MTGIGRATDSVMRGGENSFFSGLLIQYYLLSEAHLCAGNNVEFQLLVNKASTCLRQISLVENKTVSSKTARAAKFLQPFCPLWVQLSVGFFVLGFEHANNFLTRTEDGR